MREIISGGWQRLYLCQCPVAPACRNKPAGRVCLPADRLCLSFDGEGLSPERLRTSLTGARRGRRVGKVSLKGAGKGLAGSGKGMRGRPMSPRARAKYTRAPERWIGRTGLSLGRAERESAASSRGGCAAGGGMRRRSRWLGGSAREICGGVVGMRGVRTGMVGGARLGGGVGVEGCFGAEEDVGNGALGRCVSRTRSLKLLS